MRAWWCKVSDTGSRRCCSLTFVLQCLSAGLHVRLVDVTARVFPVGVKQARRDVAMHRTEHTVSADARLWRCGVVPIMVKKTVFFDAQQCCNVVPTLANKNVCQRSGCVCVCVNEATSAQRSQEHSAVIDRQSMWLPPCRGRVHEEPCMTSKECRIF